MTSSLASSKHQNPLVGDVSYYGVIEDIIEVDFWSHFSVVLFRCDWFHAKVDEFGLTRVNFKRLCYKDDPFILASQAHQVFYVQDPVEHDIHYAMKRTPRDLYDFQGSNMEMYWKEPTDSVHTLAGASDMNASQIGDESSVRIVEIGDILEGGYHVDEREDSSDIDDTDWEWMYANDEV